MSSENLVCVVCQKPSLLRCGGCRKVVYCSKEHQKIDWKIHKKKCCRTGGDVFKVEKDDKLGRHLISTRAIPEGETILQEAPLVSGPLQLTQPVCLGCFDLINKRTWRECSQCGWPMCSVNCANSPSHKPECDITEKYKKSKVNTSTFEDGFLQLYYQCVIVLRCLYLKKSNEEAWDKISELDSHYEERKKTKKEDAHNVAQFIQQFFNYSEFTEEDVLKMTGIIEVNGHMVPLKVPGYVSIYDKASLIEHNCRANCSKSFSQDGKVIIRAARPIRKGEHLSISYTESLWGVGARREHLLDTKYFFCECDRCNDPTEMGTNFNSIKCRTSDCEGYMVPLSTGISTQSFWQCLTCKTSTSMNEDIANMFLDIKEGFFKLDRRSSDSCKKFLTTYGKYLHPNHHYMVEVKLSFLQSVEGEKLCRASGQDLELMVDMCNDLIRLVSQLVPAESRLRGVLYFHLHSATVELDKRKALNGEFDDVQLRQNFLKQRDIVMTAYSFLKSEPEVLPEGKMAAHALTYIQEINDILERS